MYHIIAKIYYTILVLRNFLYSLISKKIDYKEIPIIINNRNRLTFLKQLIESLQNMGYKNIIILDNNSTYPPLIEFYRSTKYQVIFLNENLGFDALDKIPLYKEIRKNYFVYTDPDVLPIEECPDDFLKFFLDTLIKYPKVQKVGFSLKIDDLPDTYENKEQVIAWEKAFYDNQINDKLYLAPIDTTFALHRPFASLSTKGRYKMIRAAHPYAARHMPWYINSKNLSDEEKYYIDHVEIGTHWSKKTNVENRSFIRRFFHN